MATVEQEIMEWRERRWPKPGDQTMWDTLKLAEEAGEVVAAVVKCHEGRLPIEELDIELGDLLIVMSALAARRGTTLEELRAKRWAEVRKR